MNGVVQEGRGGTPLRKFLRMARNISTEIEGFEIDYLFCVYPNLKWKDFRDRMPTMNDEDWTRFKNFLGSKRWWGYRSSNGPLSLNPPTGRQPVSKRDQVQFRRLPESQREEALDRNISWPLHQTKDGRWFMYQRRPDDRPGPPYYGGADLYEGRLFPVPPRQPRSDRIKNIVEKEEEKNGEGKDAEGNVTGWKNGAEQRRGRKRQLDEKEEFVPPAKDRKILKTKTKKRVKTMHGVTSSSAVDDHSLPENAPQPHINTGVQDNDGLRFDLGIYGSIGEPPGLQPLSENQLIPSMRFATSFPSFDTGFFTALPGEDHATNAFSWPQYPLIQEPHAYGWGHTFLSASDGQATLNQTSWHQPNQQHGELSAFYHGDASNFPSPSTSQSLHDGYSNVAHQVQHSLPEERDGHVHSGATVETLEAAHDEPIETAQPSANEQPSPLEESQFPTFENSTVNYSNASAGELGATWIGPPVPQIIGFDDLPQSNTYIPWDSDRFEEL